MPTADERRIREYFARLGDGDEGQEGRGKRKAEGRGGREGEGVDPLLLEARTWCCWAQGFSYLEPEIRWVLTLVYDLVGVLIAKQKRAAVNSRRARVPVGDYRGGGPSNGFNNNSNSIGNSSGSGSGIGGIGSIGGSTWNWSGLEEGRRGGGGRGSENAKNPGRLFWSGRYYLYSLMAVVRDLKEEFRVQDLVIPRFMWFAEG